MALCSQAEVMPTLASLHGVEAMIWETWRRNPSILDSFCPPEHAMPSLNAINIGFPCRHNASGAGPGAHCTYHYTVDHAKWGISTPAQQPAAGLRRAGSGDPQIVCVGGINRMSSQQKRGGGTVCFVHPALHDQVRRSMHQGCLLKPRNLVFCPFFTHFPPSFAHFQRLDARNPGCTAKSPGENGKKSKQIVKNRGN